MAAVMARSLSAPAIALLIVSVPMMLPAVAQEAPEAPDERANPTRLVTFYPHVFSVGAGNPMPGNTQYPHGEDDFSRGTPGVGCYPKAVPPVAAAGIGNCDGIPNNLLYVYSTAGFVHARFEDWSYEQFHNERGQAKDIVLDTTQDVTATFFMSADFHGWLLCQDNFPKPPSGVPWPFPCWNWDPGFFPQWQVEATLFLGNMGEYQGQASDPPPVHEKVLSGDVVEVAKGLSAPQDMLSLDASVSPTGGSEVYEFPINLGKPLVDRIPREADWVMRFRWWMRNGDNTFLLGQPLNWNLNSGEFYPNRFSLPVKNPFDVELVFPSFVHDKLLIHTMLNSPWGSYDVDSDSVTLEITTDAGQPVQPQRLTEVADFSVAHGGHYKPVNVTWVWDYKADGLKPGAYKVSVTASNYQHSAASTTTATFRINADGSGTTLTVGRSGQQTFTEDQLRAAEQSAAGGAGSG